MTHRRDKLDQLLAKARELPKTPGVYLMKDAQGRVIYVGKAGNLPNRVSSYFIPSADLGPKKQSMLGVVDDFDIIECEGEWEALLTENRLIKDIHPRFNARLTDDKTFPYLVITLRDDFPGVYITREPSNPEFKGAKVLGPFTSSGALREAMQLLQRVFKFRTCHLEINDTDPKQDGRAYFRPCLLHPIKQCTAPCAAKISKAAYREDIDRFIRFLESKRSVMLRELRNEMEQASKDLAFERAAVLRDQIKAIEKLDERGKKSQGWQPEAETFYSDPTKGLESLRKTLGRDEPIRYIECIDIAHLQGGETVGSKVAFIDGRPLKNLYRRYKINTIAGGNDDYGSIREVVSRRYREAGQGHELYPDLIVIDGGLGQLHAARDAFDQLDMKPPQVIALAKKEELIYTEQKREPIHLARNNAGLKLCQAIRDEAHRFAQHYHHILRRKKVIGE
ncbi:UvrB/UvrC motif-containing protein [Phycisphaerales bacterium AB-hyl4]|uniref:UvrB/UvrC motif-containing protein n=1 Tax=Natronomicrosphaera hydrolytica TaxID=3242702 RepID=A0ABV4U541_9BACT